MNEQISEYVNQRDPYVCILIPCYTGKCCIEFIESLTKTVDLCKMNRIRCKYMFMKDDKLINRARSNLVAKALSIDGVSHIMFINDNVIWNPHDIFKLLLSDKFVVGGACPKKKINWENIVTHPNCISVFNDKNKTSFSNELFLQHKLCDYNITFDSNSSLSIHKNITKVDKMSLDFIMIKRDVFNKLFIAYPSTKYIDENDVLSERENEFAYLLFDTGKEKNTLLSDDDVFCKRWNSIGGSIWLDVSIFLSITGDYVYNGCFYNSLI